MSKTSTQGAQQATAESIAKEFELTRNDVQKITSHFAKQIRRGLTGNYPYQIPTYVTKIPSGLEKGLFLAVDLGGTNCRVCAVNLHGDSTFNVFQRKHVVPAEIRVNSSYKPLFRFIAAKIQEFLQEYSQEEKEVEPKDKSFDLGFTFSFTCEQTSLARGTLVHWDKGWDIPDALGKDPCALLQHAIDEISVPVRVCVLANDAVGTLLARSYTAQRSNSTLAAIILGTGTNAAYVEKIANVQRLAASEESSNVSLKEGLMLINTEWGSWDDGLEVLPQTPYDKLIDEASSDPGCGLLEKMVSGMYLGELMRLAILHLMQSNGLDMSIDEKSPVHTHLGVESAFLSDITRLPTSDSQPTISHIANTLVASGVTSKDVQIIQMLASTIVTRSATLVGAGLAAIIIQSGRLESPALLPKAAITTRVDELREKPARAWLLKHLTPLARSIRRIFGCIDPQEEGKAAPREVSCSSDETITSSLQADDVIDIGVDGSLFEYYPKFETIMRSVLRDISEIGPSGEEKIRIQLTKDGSGTGAALIAAVAEGRK